MISFMEDFSFRINFFLMTHQKKVLFTYFLLVHYMISGTAFCNSENVNLDTFDETKKPSIPSEVREEIVRLRKVIHDREVIQKELRNVRFSFSSLTMQLQNLSTVVCRLEYPSRGLLNLGMSIPDELDTISKFQQKHPIVEISRHNGEVLRNCQADLTRLESTIPPGWVINDSGNVELRKDVSQGLMELRIKSQSERS
jgi:hypothetical protein